jgi:hypothetical protein
MEIENKLTETMPHINNLLYKERLPNFQTLRAILIHLDKSKKKITQ